nr:MAG TPA: hypothetical protein [Caudoviricetes sp.]
MTAAGRLCYNRLAGVQRQRFLLLNPLPARCGGGEGKLLYPASCYRTGRLSYPRRSL